mgnify:CR=1 FL=1
MLHPAVDVTAERTGLLADLRVVLDVLAYYGRVALLKSSASDLF